MMDPGRQDSPAGQGVNDCLQLLRQFREDGVRQSDRVVHVWEHTLSRDPSALGDERWMIVEQVCVAAMDVHRQDLVEQCLRDLRRNFDADSLRVRRLYGMRHEMMGDYAAALQIYDAILEEDDSNSQARKRKIAIHRALGDNVKAVAELNKYLHDFMSDGESWMELCDLYIKEQDYTKAAHCCEELILHNPNNHIYFQRYAEIRYTQGGFENMELAKAYYSKAVALNAGNMRALYGLLLTSSQLASSPKCMASKKKEYVKTVLWASKQIKKQYEDRDLGQTPAAYLDSVLGQMQAIAPMTS